MRRLVVDASVAAKWLLTEPGSDAAVRLLEEEDVAFHAPELFDAELGNAFWKRVQRRELDAIEATGMVALVTGMPVTRHSHEELLEPAFTLAIDLSITVYDSLYVALAVSLDAPLATADRWLRERASCVVDIRD
jgi:predicted nucleic acid-binding protein